MIQLNSDTLVGDANLFIQQPEEEENHHIAELDVMIAEVEFRKRGIASKAIELLMEFAQSELGISRFVVKILQENQASISMFTKLGFQFVRKQEAFGEVVYQLVTRSINE